MNYVCSFLKNSDSGNFSGNFRGFRRLVLIKYGHFRYKKTQY